MSTTPDAETVEIRVERATQLFDNHDPFPFMERSLDPGAEAYILSHTENLSPRRPIHLVVHLPPQEAASQAAGRIELDITRYFNARADATQRSLSALFRIGRRALLIGLAVLAASLIAVKFADNLPGARFPKLFAEGLTIFGWVANWQRNVYRRLAKAKVSVRATG
jgi:hypothetical protein